MMHQRWRLRAWIAGPLLGVAALLSPAEAGADLEAEVQAFEAEDSANPPPPNASLFIGSSSIRLWPDLERVLPCRTVLNRGFGGSQMSDVLFYFDRLVARYRPSLIVIYEGDNDLAAGRSVRQVLRDYSDFVARVERQLPDTAIAFIAVKPSPSRAHLQSKNRRLNELLRELAEARHLRFIDVFTPMLDAAGEARPELFEADMLHLNSTGYDLWESLVRDGLRGTNHGDSDLNCPARQGTSAPGSN